MQLSRLADLTSLACNLALVAMCVAVIVRRLDRLPSDRRTALLILLLPWIYQVTRDLYADISIKQGAVVYPLLMLVAWVLRPRLRELATLGYLIGLTAVMSLLLGAILPEKGVLVSSAGGLVTPDKEILPWGILVGPFTDGNPLGQFMAIGIVAAAFIARRGLRLALIAATGLAVLWTSSRSSLFALATAVIIVTVVRLTARGLRAWVVGAALVALAALVVTLPLTATTNEAFTNRGYIWRASLQAWRVDPWFGLGSQWYAQSARYANNIGSTAYHGHNIFVQLLVLGGIVNVVLVGLLVATVALAAVTRLINGEGAAPCILVAAILVVGRPRGLALLRPPEFPAARDSRPHRRRGAGGIAPRTDAFCALRSRPPAVLDPAAPCRSRGRPRRPGRGAVGAARGSGEDDAPDRGADEFERLHGALEPAYAHAGSVGHHEDGVDQGGEHEQAVLLEHGTTDEHDDVDVRAEVGDQLLHGGGPEDGAALGDGGAGGEPLEAVVVAHEELAPAPVPTQDVGESDDAHRPVPTGVGARGESEIDGGGVRRGDDVADGVDEGGAAGSRASGPFAGDAGDAVGGPGPGPVLGPGGGEVDVDDDDVQAPPCAGRARAGRRPGWCCRARRGWSRAGARGPGRPMSSRSGERGRSRLRIRPRGRGCREQGRRRRRLCVPVRGAGCARRGRGRRPDRRGRPPRTRGSGRA